MAFVIALGGISMLFRPAVPAAIGVDELEKMPQIINTVPLAEKVYVVSMGSIKEEELDTAICLQGLVNREKAQLYMTDGGIYKAYLDAICKEGVEVVTAAPDGSEWNLQSLIKEFKSCITDGGYVLYRNSEFAEGLNTACNYATLNGWLAVPEELKDSAEECGLTLKKDISKDDYNFKYLDKFFEENKDGFNKNAVVHVKTVFKGLRDLAIQQKFFITYSDETVSGKSHLKKVMKWTGGNSYILGWAETEKHFVRFISGYGCAVIPSDHSRNTSFLNAYKCEIPAQTGKGEPVKADFSKHYAAIVFSDGDNSQWVQNDFGAYYQKIGSFDTFPMTWTFPLIQQEINPACSERIYNLAGKNNSFAAGVSGSGYMNPSQFKPKCLDKYTAQTAAMMLKSNIDVVTILDDKPSLLGEKAYAQSFDYYSRFENIRGGIVMQDPGRYESGKGRVWFSNGKPFISVRLSLWYTDGAEGEAVPDEWIEAQAAKVNSSAKNPASIDGYTVINVNPWTFTVENLVYFVSLLDENVQLVTAEQLIDLMTENAEHINAAPAEY